MHSLMLWLPSSTSQQERPALESVASQWREVQLQATLMQQELDDVTRLAQAKDNELKCVGW